VPDVDPAEFERMRAQLQELTDREAIRDCVLRYARGLDRHDLEIYKSAYHPDGIDEHGPYLGYRDEFCQWGLDLLASEWDIHSHFQTNIRIEIDGDTAHSETYCLFCQRRRDGEKHLEFGGARYIDRLERRDGEWRIVARELVNEWLGQMRRGVFAGADRYTSGRWDREDPSYQRPFVLPEPEGAS
jgi:hypothetical protein